MKRFVKSLLYLICLIVVLIIPYFVFAADIPANAVSADSALGKLMTVGIASGYDPVTDKNSAAGIVGTVVSVFFSILGIIFVVLILYGGYNWMTAMGDNAKVEKAKDTIFRAIVGLIFTVSAWAIWYLIFTYFLGAGTVGSMAGN